jgi:predicted metal-binding protein
MDMEDMGLPFVSGAALYEDVRARVQADADGLGGALAVVPVECLSTCYRASSISYVCPGKFAYQFGDLDPRSAGGDVVAFARQYVAAPDGFSKTKTRPPGLRSNILARIPPLPLPTSVVPPEYRDAVP